MIPVHSRVQRVVIAIVLVLAVGAPLALAGETSKYLTADGGIYTLLVTFSDPNLQGVDSKNLPQGRKTWASSSFTATFQTDKNDALITWAKDAEKDKSAFRNVVINYLDSNGKLVGSLHYEQVIPTSLKPGSSSTFTITCEYKAGTWELP